MSTPAPPDARAQAYGGVRTRRFARDGKYGCLLAPHSGGSFPLTSGPKAITDYELQRLAVQDGVPEPGIWSTLRRGDPGRRGQMREELERLLYRLGMRPMMKSGAVKPFDVRAGLS